MFRAAMASFVIWVSLGIAASSAAKASDDLLSSLAERDRQSIVYIRADYFDEKTKTTQAGEVGTGFIISKNGYVLTTTHVVKDWLGQSSAARETNPLLIKIASKNASVSYLARVVQADLATDIALLRITDTSRSYSAVPICMGNSMKPGEAVYSLGFPNNHDFTPLAGTYSNDNNPDGYYEASIAFARGMSGGPVYNAAGVIVGMVEGGVDFSQATSFFIPLRLAKSMIADRTDVTSACGNADSNVVTAAKAFSVPDSFCPRLQQVITAAKTGFRGFYTKNNMGMLTPKVSIPGAIWCFLNDMPGYGDQRPSMYYSCMLERDQKDKEGVKSAREAYARAASLCMGRNWARGEDVIGSNGDEAEIIFTPNQGVMNFKFRTTTDRDGQDLVIYINPS